MNRVRVGLLFIKSSLYLFRTKDSDLGNKEDPINCSLSWAIQLMEKFLKTT
jgi:hypothetical protein